MNWLDQVPWIAVAMMDHREEISTWYATLSGDDHLRWSYRQELPEVTGFGFLAASGDDPRFG
jgi:hypothetical protein